MAAKPGSGLALFVHDILHLVEEFAGDYGFVLPFVKLSIPAEIPVVNRIV